MNPENLKNKISRIPVLWKSGMVILMSGVLIGGFVFAQDIPYEEGKVYVCPLATKIEEVNPKCQCRIDLVLGETVKSTCPIDGKNYEMTLTITEYEGKEYYAILGFENGGAGVNFEPQAKIFVPSQGYLDKEILFDGSQSQDPNQDPLDFFWDFGDGNFGEGEKISHIYQNPGEYLVTLTVSDGMASSSSTTTIKIFSPPVVPISGGFAFFEKEKEIQKEEIKEAPKKEKILETEKPKQITKILKIEKPEQKIEKKEETKETPEIKKKIKPEIQTPSQNLTPFLLASLKETIKTPSIIIPSIFSLSVLLFILIKEIKMPKRK